MKHEPEIVVTNPEVVVASLPHFRSVADHIRYQPWSEVTSKIDRIAGLPAPASTNAEDDEEQSEWCQWPGAQIRVVLESVDEEHQQRASDEFTEKLAGIRHVGLRVRAEDAGSGSVREARDGADVCSTLEDVNGRFVVGVDNS